MKDLTRITFDSKTMGGKSCIRGMRVTVGMIVGLIAVGHSFEEILRACPYFDEEDLRESLRYAARRGNRSSVCRMKILIDINLLPDRAADLGKRNRKT